MRLCPGEEQWVEGDFHTGDVLTFPCFTVHKALPSRFRDRIRLSLDVRFQPASDPIDEKSLRPHANLDWEEVYADWTTDDLKYYWRHQSPTLATWDDKYKQPGPRIC